MRITLNVRNTLVIALAVVALAIAVAPIDAWSAEQSAGAPATTTVDNPYGLEALWAAGDFVSRGTLGILFIMSLGSWYIGIIKLIEQSRLLREAKAARKEFWAAPTVEAGALKLEEDSAFRYLADEGIKAATHHEGTLTQSIDLSTWIGMSLQRAFDEISDRLQGGLAFLGTVGSTAPFVGLFGTVWGIYHALTAIGISGQASIDKVAGPVGESLIMTAIGLAVAVPAVLGYNWMVRRNKTAMAAVRHFSSELHMVLLAGGKTGARK
ncbi:MAG: MotA/TolQ/ExbB proton channel family protein [Rhodocyclaceae bacterium]|nr:MotA/TolQ/ExbB proton channel family protein [Rhodocyclaceae bacterium]